MTSLFAARYLFVFILLFYRPIGAAFVRDNTILLPKRVAKPFSKVKPYSCAAKQIGRVMQIKRRKNWKIPS